MQKLLRICRAWRPFGTSLFHLFFYLPAAGVTKNVVAGVWVHTHCRVALEQGFPVVPLCPRERLCCELRESNGKHTECERQACWQCSDPAQRGWLAVRSSSASKHRLPSSGRMRKRVGFLARAYTCVREAEVAERLLTRRLGSWSRSGLTDNSPAINDPPMLSAHEHCCQTNVAVHGQSQNEETLSCEEVRTVAFTLRCSATFALPRTAEDRAVCVTYLDLYFFNMIICFFCYSIFRLTTKQYREAESKALLRGF